MKRSGRSKQRRQNNAASCRTHGGHWTTGLTALALISLGFALARAADATTPVDLTQRNASYVPAAGATVKPDKQVPVTNATVQDKRFDKTTVEKSMAPQGDRRAGIAVQENNEKHVREKDSRRPETREQPV